MPPKMKPPPWKCGMCRERAVVPVEIPYEAEVEHDGRAYCVTFPTLRVLRCERCGTVVLDDAANERISEELRLQAGLLTPEEIHTGRQTLGLTQKQLAGCLGIAEATLSRWETGAQIQQRALDRFLRVYLHFPSVRAVLGREQAPEPTRPGAAPGFRCLASTPELLARACQFRLRRARQSEPTNGPKAAPTPPAKKSVAGS